MTTKIDPDDLVDTVAIAELLGLASNRVVSALRSRHADFPEPIVNLGPRRATLWHRDDVITWAENTGRAVTR